MTVCGRGGAALLLLAGLAMLAGGCGSGASTGGPAQDKGGKDKQSQAARAEKKAHDHSGWWCDEHGIPEAECSLCSAKVAAAFKKKGDWCDKHQRAKSQCFICNPERKEYYAAKYRAKYGKEPPPIEEEAN